jgi:hypothetical protein
MKAVRCAPALCSGKPNDLAAGTASHRLNPDSPDGSKRHHRRVWESGETEESYFHPLPGVLFPARTRQTIEAEGKSASSTMKR